MKGCITILRLLLTVGFIALPPNQAKAFTPIYFGSCRIASPSGTHFVDYRLVEEPMSETRREVVCRTGEVIPEAVTINSALFPKFLPQEGAPLLDMQDAFPVDVRITYETRLENAPRMTFLSDKSSHMMLLDVHGDNAGVVLSAQSACTLMQYDGKIIKTHSIGALCSITIGLEDDVANEFNWWLVTAWYDSESDSVVVLTDPERNRGPLTGKLLEGRRIRMVDGTIEPITIDETRAMLNAPSRMTRIGARLLLLFGKWNLNEELGDNAVRCSRTRFERGLSNVTIAKIASSPTVQSEIESGLSPSNLGPMEWPVVLDSMNNELESYLMHRILSWSEEFINKRTFSRILVRAVDAYDTNYDWNVLLSRNRAMCIDALDDMIRNNETLYDAEATRTRIQARAKMQ